MFIIVCTYITRAAIRAIILYSIRFPHFQYAPPPPSSRGIGQPSNGMMVMIKSFYYGSRRGRGIAIIAIVIYSMQMIFYL